LAAEYCTEYGDVIAINIEKEIKDMQFDKFISSVRAQGGYILFPHPYVGHKNIEKIAENSDFIEVFNSRVSSDKNKKSEELAKKYSKIPYFSSDAHNKKSLKNGIVTFKKEDTLIESMLKNEMSLASADKTFLYEIYLSQIIKSIKQKNIKLLTRMLLGTAKKLLLLELFKKV